jgi:3-hydroxybutyryl-CoA dehydrogenase
MKSETPSRPGPRRLGVVGAGTMGVGIAETGLREGLEVTLVDISPHALARAAGQIADQDGRLTTSADLADLAGCDAVIEAIAESLEAKRDLFGRLTEICPTATPLATNTSSLRVAAIAAGAAEPGRLLGLHFFNPVPRMPLVELVPGPETDAATLAAARLLAEALGKRPIVAADGIGFLVNRCGRPFGNEALRLLQERIATAEQIDRICRLGGGFRMGPFELLDLIGLDVNLAINESFWAQSYGEPRWRPSPLQAQMVAAGRLGRKSGRGFYTYGDGRHRPPDEPPPDPGDGRGRIVSISGTGVVATALRSRATAAGFAPAESRPAEDPWLRVEADPLGRAAVDGDRWPRTVLCAGTSLAGSGYLTSAGFHLIGPVPERGGLAETTAGPLTDPEAAARAEDFFTTLGFATEAVGDAPGLVLGRIVGQLVNEALFALAEGVGSAADIDTGMTLGLNHPRGPLAWGEAAGLPQVRSTLDALGAWTGEERYRLAPALRQGR